MPTPKKLEKCDLDKRYSRANLKRKAVLCEREKGSWPSHSESFKGPKAMLVEPKGVDWAEDQVRNSSLCQARQTNELHMG